MQGLRKLLSASIDALPASARYRVRNTLALARWAADDLVRGITTRMPSRYDDAFWECTGSGDWMSAASLVMRYCRPASVIDIGCGEGNLLAALTQRAPDLRLAGIDGSSAALQRARGRGLPVSSAQMAGWQPSRTRALRERIEGFDLAVCLETAEHLPAWCARPLVEALTAAPLVLFSAAHPNQGGTLHMNEQPFEYWRSRFARCGFDLSPDDAAFRRDLQAIDLPHWYRANAHLFARVRPA